MNITLAVNEDCPELTLTAEEITTVTFAGQDLQSVEVIVIETAGDRVRWTCDGSEPSVDHGWYVPLDGVDEREPLTSGSTIVKLWCSGTAMACVQRG